MEETKLTLERLIEDIANEYKAQLSAAGKSATGNLIKSIHSNGVTETSDGYEGSISAAEYAKYVEDGRRPGKFPPPPAIQGWVKTKFPSVPLIQQRQIAYLIGRKIARFGIPAGNYLQKAIEIVFPRYNLQINSSIMKDLLLN